MYKLKTTILVLFATSVFYAQNAGQVGWVSKFGLAGGFTPIYLIPDLDVLNEAALQFEVEQFSSSGIVTYGGAGYAYLMLIDNVRIGGMGFSGSKSSSSGDKEIIYGIGGGALSLEYTFPQIKRVALSAGLLLGRGSVDVEVYQNNGEFSWIDTWTDFTGTDKKLRNNSRKLTNSYWTISPTLNLDIPVNRFIAFRIGAGYQLTFYDEWNVDNNKEINDVPSDLNGNAFFIQTGIFLGFFAF
ncbi:MAG: hypothetical protein JW995_00910 [Melioribacteraceae bacterium]|nr:hypothetical protein [Melioribacteraceae bacterium]